MTKRTICISQSRRLGKLAIYSRIMCPYPYTVPSFRFRLLWLIWDISAVSYQVQLTCVTNLSMLSIHQIILLSSIFFQRINVVYCSIMDRGEQA